MTALPTTGHALKDPGQRQKCHIRAQAAVISLGCLGLILPLLSPRLSWVIVAATILSLIALTPRGHTIRPLLVGFCLMTLALVRWADQQPSDACWGEDMIVSGQVVGLPRISAANKRAESAQRFDFDVVSTASEHCDVTGRIKLSYWQLEPVVSAGQQLTLQTRLRPPVSQWAPGAVPDAVRNLVDGVRGRGTVKSLIESHDGSPWQWSVLRAKLATRIEKQLGETQAAALVAALAIGDSRTLSAGDWNQFRALGIVHVLVISGLHVGLVYLMARTFFTRLVSGVFAHYRPASLPLGIWLARLLALVMAIFYGFMGGAGVPVIRAIVFLLIYEGVRLLGWRTSALWVLVLTVLLLLCANPLAVVDQSLWLSVTATATLIGVGRLCNAIVVPGSNPFITALLTQICVLPVMAPWLLFWLGELSVVSVLGNLLLVPLVSLTVVPSALLGDVWALLLPSMTNMPWQLASYILSIWLVLADSLHGFVAPAALLSAPLSVWELLLLITLPGLWLLRWVWPLRLLVAGGLLLFVELARLASINGDSADLWLLDVGQGLAVLWQQPDHNLLFDTGWGSADNPGQMEKVVLPALRALGISQLEHLVVSHADDDHSGGLSTLRAKMPISTHWGYTGRPCRPGAVLWRSDQGYAQFLSGDGQSETERNSQSCVLLLSYRGQRLLVTGDIPMARERELVRYWREALGASVLVVAHHGSASSTGATLLKWVKPGWALISAGWYNRFGHPAAAVLERLGNAGISILNSAKAGSIRVTFREQGITVSPLRDPWVPFWLQIPPLGRPG